MITPDQERLFWFYREQRGYSISASAREAKFSRETARQLIRRRAGIAQRPKAGTPGGATPEKERRTPDPIPLERLGSDARAMLEDFALFSERIFAVRAVPWQIEAAKKTVDWIVAGHETQEKFFAVANEPPGSGKSTLWSFRIPAWLICGGGLVDPRWGRAIRILLGHASKAEATKYVLRLRRLLELTRPFYNKDEARYAEVCITEAFGRFKPIPSAGEERIWQDVQFIVAQLEDVDLYDKEPTVQAAGIGSEYIGNRALYSCWDDLVTPKTYSIDPEKNEERANQFEDEAETRVEPGGCLWLVGQRLGPSDLFRNRLDMRWADEQGQEHAKYEHIVFPVHNEETCKAEETGAHSQWDARPDGQGCLLDAVRYPWREILKLRGRPNYRTVYQQEDADPLSVLVLTPWLEGGTDPFGYEAPGCFDTNRGFWEWPEGVGDLVNYVVVDPAASVGYWAIEWWAIQAAPIEPRFRYLIAAVRKRLSWGRVQPTELGNDHLLDWDPHMNRWTGIMEDWQVASVAGNHPIRVWVIEHNSAFKGLFQFDHFRRWQQKWSSVVVIPHETQKNKHDPAMGVHALLGPAYRTGVKRLPRRPGDLDALNYLRAKNQELTSWPKGRTEDTVMADWMGEANMAKILSVGTRAVGHWEAPMAGIPPYLRNQQRAMRYAPA